MTMFVALYAHLLRLYPASFYALFADDMLDVFQMGLQDAMRYDHEWAFYLREFVGLFAGILREHLINWTRRKRIAATSMQRTHNLTRMAAFTLNLVFL